MSISERVRIKGVWEAVALLLLCICCPDLHAQRTMDGQQSISLYVISESADSLSRSVSVSYGSYLKTSMWEAGLSRQSSHGLCAWGCWRYRIVSTRNRTLSIYAGAGAAAGWSPADGQTDEQEETQNTGTYGYGIFASAQAELFLAGRVALIFTGTVPAGFNTPLQDIRPLASAGLRINL